MQGEVEKVSSYRSRPDLNSGGFDMDAFTMLIPSLYEDVAPRRFDAVVVVGFTEATAFTSKFPHSQSTTTSPLSFNVLDLLVAENKDLVRDPMRLLTEWFQVLALATSSLAAGLSLLSLRAYFCVC
jgi:uncharacterized protein YfaP (DUF2135 family)